MPGKRVRYARDAFVGVCECANIPRARATMVSGMDESPAALLRSDDLARHCAYAPGAPREQRFPPLEGGRACDIAVVGGGLAGLSAAIELADRGFAVTLLEARDVGSGASGRNGGQALTGLACEPHVIEAQLGLAAARMVWDAGIEALDLIHRRCERFAIDCEWRSGHLLTAVSARKARRLRETSDDLQQRYGEAPSFIGADEIGDWIASPRFVAALHDARSGHLHPLKYTLGLARAAASLGVTIHEQTPAMRLVAGPRPRLETPRGWLDAGRVLLAGNAYLQGIAPHLERRIMPVATYMAATEPLPEALAASLVPSGAGVCDNNFVLDYFRVAADRRLLFGGGDSVGTAMPRGVDAMLGRRITQVFPQLERIRIESVWGGYVDLTLNLAPDFGRLSARGDGANVYYVQGFSGHGLALTGLAGRIVAEAIAGDATRFDTFARLKHRPFPGGARFRGAALRLGLAWYRLRDMLAA
ncbi:MAG: FAD-dependent oxidoreductase [Caldimonas sp.]